MLPSITAAFNKSLTSGVFPSIYKSALVKPLLIKPSVDPNDLTNYRTVSNLPFFVCLKSSNESSSPNSKNT